MTCLVTGKCFCGMRKDNHGVCRNCEKPPYKSTAYSRISCSTNKVVSDFIEVLISSGYTKDTIIECLDNYKEECNADAQV